MLHKVLGPLIAIARVLGHQPAEDGGELVRIPLPQT